MMRDAHARMHPDARDGPLSARRVLPPCYTAGSYCAILPDSFAITHNVFHPLPLRPQVLFRVCLGLLNTVLSQFSLVSLTFFL